MYNTHALINQFVDKARNHKVNIAVIGDLMLDEYYNVSVNRISPEFPIQIMKSNTDFPYQVLPGGAANVAYQTAFLNTECNLFGCIDENARQILSRYTFKLKTVDHKKQIPRKKRFYDGKYALMRWDVEDLYEEDFGDWSEAREKVIKDFTEHLTVLPDVVILSDYNKGFFKGNTAQTIIKLCNELNIPTIVDPKTKPIDRWYGCTVFKPNYTEATLLTNSDPNPCRRLKDKVDCQAVVMTMGKIGVMTHESYDDYKCQIYHPERYIDDQSVIGAGDCFAATYAVALAHKFDFHEASIIAYEAGAAYVQDRYNKPITLLQLNQAIDPVQAKIYRNPQYLSEDLQHLPGIKVFTNGCFDTLHNGHLSTLKFAKNEGDILIVAVDTDDNIKAQKGPSRPINNLEARMNLLAAIEYVDFVVPFEGSPAKLIEALKPIDVLVKSKPWTVDSTIGRSLVGRVAIAPTIEGVSTTQIIEKIKHG